MTELERRALLGDRKAQKDCTRQGIVLPCPCCGRPIKHHESFLVHPPSTCILNLLSFEETDANKIALWNTRIAPPIGLCRDCDSWSGKPGDEDAPCRDCDGVMEADNFCKNFEPREVRNR